MVVNKVEVLGELKKNRRPLTYEVIFSPNHTIPTTYFPLIKLYGLKLSGILVLLPKKPYTLLNLRPHNTALSSLRGLLTSQLETQFFVWACLLIEIQKYPCLRNCIHVAEGHLLLSYWIQTRGLHVFHFCYFIKTYKYGDSIGGTSFVLLAKNWDVQIMEDETDKTHSRYAKGLTYINTKCLQET